MKIASTLLIALTLGLSTPLLHAQLVPGLISYQGKVTDNLGTGLGTGAAINRKMLFRIYDNANPGSGSLLWSEEQTVTLFNGEFSVILGQGALPSNGEGPNPKPSLLDVFNGTERYLELVVDGGDNAFTGADSAITPRQRLISSAFAVRAAAADSVTAGSDLRLKDANSGLGWYGSGRLFNGTALDGPALYGFGGGVLGTSNGATKNTALRWNNTGNVGIGGVSPSSTHKLDVAGSIHTSTDLVVDGKIGVNTINPIARIGIRSDTAGNPAMAFEFSGGGYRHFLQTRHLNNNTGLGNAIDFFLNQSGTDAGSSAPNTGNVVGMTIDAKGVGIGPNTTAPSATLDVNGTAKVTGSLAAGSISTAGSLSAGSISGIRLPGAPAIADGQPGTFNPGGYISFNHHNNSEDYIGYRDNTFFLRDADGGGDIAQPDLNVGGRVNIGGNKDSPGNPTNVTGAPTNNTGGDGMRLTLYPGTPTVTPFGFGIDNSTLFSVVPVNSSHKWYIGTTERMQLNAAGDLYVKNVPVAEESLRIIRGNLPNTNTTSGTGTGFTYTNVGGDYTISFGTAFTGVPTVTANVVGIADQDIVRIRSMSTTGTVISVRNAANGNLTNFPINFIAVGPR